MLPWPRPTRPPKPRPGQRPRRDRPSDFDQGFVRTLIAGKVTLTRPSAALVVLAAKVDGEVRTLLDWRGGLAFGMGLGIVATVARALRRR